MKELWIDVETTGLSPHKNFVWQIAGIIIEEGKILEEFDLKIKPPRGAIINQKALEVGGITVKDLEGFPDHSVQYKALTDIFKKYVDKYNKQDKFTFHGYNCHFDVGFVRAFFLANGDEYYGSWIWSNNIDVMVLAGKYLKKERHLMKNFKLGTVMEYLDVEVEGDLHDGMTDIKGTRGIYIKIGGK